MNNSEQINIILLGQTGVGKTTFINALANYATFDSLSDARLNVVQTLIPCSFTITNEEFEHRKISLGEDQNEFNQVEGQSCTQRCKTYTFLFGKRVVRIIDTPGIGDTRGVEQDQFNFEDILYCISQLNYINYFCFLLKPNQPRLTVSFEYCIKMLLANLEKKASKYFSFVFTNSRSTFYRPGETGTLMRSLLNSVKERPPHVDIPFNKNNIFCLDNEAFRFLVAINNGISFSPSEISSFENSWMISAKECGRLLEYIIGNSSEQSGLTPYLVRETVCVNDARRHIQLLVQPMIEVQQIINDNLAHVEKYREEIEKRKNSINLLKESIHFLLYDIELTHINHPEMVCASDKCSDKYEVGGMTKKNYSKICHENCKCKLRGLDEEIVGDIRLKKCRSINFWGNCKRCKCSYKSHLIVFYRTRVVEKSVENKEVEEELKKEKSATVLAQKMVAHSEKYRDDLKNEMNMITEIMAKFARYLKDNAILTYNDAFKSYLEHIIEKEKTSPSNKKSNTSFEKLSKLLENYEKSKELLDQSLVNNSNNLLITTGQVYKLLSQLYSLKYFGKKLLEMKETQELAAKRGFDLAEIGFEQATDVNLSSDQLNKIKINNLTINSTKLNSPMHNSLGNLSPRTPEPPKVVSFASSFSGSPSQNVIDNPIMQRDHVHFEQMENSYQQAFDLPRPPLPPPPPPRQEHYYRVLFDNMATADNILSVRRGEVLKLIDGSGRDWWFMQNDQGIQGYVPAYYLGKTDFI